MTARLCLVSSSDWPASETKLRSTRTSETVLSAISIDLSGLSTKTLSSSPHCSSKRPRPSSESGSTRRATRPRRSLSTLSASSSEPLSCAVRSYSEPNSSLLRSRCSSLLCAALRREAKNSASNKTKITTTTMITIRVVVLTSPPPAGLSVLHYSPKCNPRNVAGPSSLPDRLRRTLGCQSVQRYPASPLGPRVSMNWKQHGRHEAPEKE